MKVLCAGLMVCDILIKPISEETLHKDTATADSIELHGGGDAFNVAVNLASLGVEVSLASRVGEDEMGRLVTNHALDAGVDISGVLRVMRPTSASAVLIRENGERSFVSFKGACHTFSQDDITDSMLEKHDILYVGSAFDLPVLDGEGLEKLFRRARNRGVVTVLDTTADPGREQFDVLAPAIGQTDIFLPSLKEALSLSGKTTPELAASFFRSHGSRTVAIKMGSRGCYISADMFQGFVHAYAAEPVDTTGAGDAFVSGFIAAFIRGLSAEECARIGNAAGSVCVGRVGATGGLSSFTQLAGIAGLEV